MLSAASRSPSALERVLNASGLDALNLAKASIQRS